MAGEQEAKKMVTLRQGVSSFGRTSMPSASRLLPVPCTGEPKAAAEVSSPPRSKVSPSRTAAFDATDPKTEPEVEGSAGRNTNTLHDMTVGRRGRYGSHLISSYGTMSLTHRKSASPSPCIRRGDEYREPHGGEGASSTVAPLLASSPACSKVSSSRAAACDAADPKPEPEVEVSAGMNTETLHEISATGGRQGRYRNHEPHGSQFVASSVAPSVDKEERRLPTRISAKNSAILENIRLQKSRQRSQLHRGGADSYWGDPQVRGKNHHLNWQTDTVSSRISSARDSKLELVDAFEGGNRSAQFKKPLAMSPRKPVTLQLPRRPSVLDKRGALDSISESRLLELTARCPKEEPPSTSTSTSNLATVPWEGETYITTLGPGGGYGYPHPPPFYRCELCRKEMAFYRLKCCHLVVCQWCGCACEKVKAVKEKLPKVKLDGSDLFLWQPCSFPSRLMLFMAKRTGNSLQYYFAKVDELMNPQLDSVEACVFDFYQQGHEVISLSKRAESLAREQLR